MERKLNPETDKKKIEDVLRLLKLNDVDLSKLSEQQRKEMKDHKFWKTQPVPSFDEKIEEEGPIHSDKTPDDIPNEPLPMLPDFEWCTVDIEDEGQLENVFVLLNENYVEDRDAEFRFNYTKDFFKWALKCPGWKPEWNVGVRVKSTGKLVSFISAIPVDLRVRSKFLKSVEINFLCIHKQLRSKRLAPVLIKEITRRVNKENIWHALYTAGTVLPSPISTCRYTHRPLNWSKLCEVGFTALPEGKTNPQMVAQYTLPKGPLMKGFRPLELKDIDETLSLFNRYQERFDLVQLFSKEEFKHWFLGSTDSKVSTESEVIYSYVVENENGKIVDFVSFYSLPFTILNNAVYKNLGIGYLFYYASDADFTYTDRLNPEASEKLKKRLNSLVKDVLIIAKSNKMDVFNALTSQDNSLFLDDLKFGPGDGFLNFYLFNYRAFPVHGGITETKKYDVEKRSDVGIVML
ncbi:hypothetical protein TPHA_0F03040 [Tetrapisispora phaffii CBS 4417]|uniref:Glycylpeptide N-tetradecanoyltransferase n=1 Tax=Tetrapisispora phaffii (strain ATCC 24235 / CBS 4417 / NBRC 1672 / NRRL Y-8282 / UCD 70-5) TaxID=1071381 RepID=G8BUJ9_TETPH|nr:hypothetical protein TPHA_0F03040 [Tetrapisispora phaffii CBS 4417]CCE63785.1 hypothetical protein TPHA_0F03040 [Tetrapisispora phaffii CBS 4417]